MSMSPKSKAEAIKKQLVIINELLKKPENKYCADCKKTSPTWASVNLGVFVCINCSGCHREIGVHITKIRSTNLDVWPKDILNNFKLINNKIANKYWECKLKKFDFKKIQNDKYKLVEFIRNKYENKLWIDPDKKFDPMSLISKGKIKKFKKLYCQDEDEENEEDDEDLENNKKSKKNKNKKAKNVSDNEDEDEKNKNKSDNSEKDEDDNNDSEEEKENDDQIKNKKSKKNPQESKSPTSQKNPQMNNLFLDFGGNNNQPQEQNLLNLNPTSNNDNNIIDLFNQNNSNNNLRPVNNMNLNTNKNINNNYFSPQPIRSGGFDNIFQQMPLNTKLNLQKNNNYNMGMNNDLLNANRINSMQNISNLNNNMMNLNLGMNNNINNMNNFNNNNNMNNFNFNNNTNMNNNQNINNQVKNNSNTFSSSSKNNPIAFNMDYFNKNMESKKSNAGSTYNFKKNKVDPFANLVSFKK